jgi:hypothetical protein
MDYIACGIGWFLGHAPLLLAVLMAGGVTYFVFSILEGS